MTGAPPGLLAGVDAALAWRRLAEALIGYVPACSADPDSWFEPPTSAVVEACRRCDARAACIEFAVANDERFGIWAGVDFTDPHRRKQAVQSTRNPYESGEVMP